VGQPWAFKAGACQAAAVHAVAAYTGGLKKLFAHDNGIGQATRVACISIFLPCIAAGCGGKQQEGIKYFLTEFMHEVLADKMVRYAM